MRTALLGFAVLIGTVVAYAPTSSAQKSFFNDRYCTIGGRGITGFPIAPTPPGSSVVPARAALADTAPRIRSGSRARQAHGFSGGSQFDGRAAEKPGNSSRLEESSGAHRAAATPAVVAGRQRSAP